MKTTEAQVEKISPLTDSIIQIMLRPKTYIDYQAGQYLKILLDNEELCYSIANAPLGSHQYELHVRHTRDNTSIQQLLKCIKKQGWVPICLPFGQCSLNHFDKNRPILFIAGGTGFAPVNAMIEQLLTLDDLKPFELFWGARKGDLYLDEKVKHWAAHTSCFKYFSRCSEEGGDSLDVLVLKQHKKDLNKWQIVISGPLDMVYSTRDILLQEGVDKNQLFSDAFHF